MKKAILLPVLLLAAACSRSNDNEALRPKVYPKPATCEQWRAVLPTDVVQDSVVVPESPGSSVAVKVFFYYRKPLHGHVAIFMNGGPGGSSHGTLTLMEGALKQFGLSDKISFVYMDQRGNGCSSPYPDSTNDSEIFERAKAYGTRGIVEDAEAIRRKLGLAKWSVIGQSYGAMIAHRYAILYPDSLDRVIAYANTITPDSRMRTAGRIGSQIDVWRAYFGAHPDDEARKNLLMTTLDQSYCSPVQGFKGDWCGYELIEEMVGSYLGWHDEWDKLHTWFGKLVVDGTVQRDAVVDFANLTAGVPSSVARQRSMGAIDYYDRDVRFMNSSTCADARIDIASAEFNVTLTECSSALQWGYSSTAYNRVANYFVGSKDPVTLAAFKAVLQTRPRGWFHLYSGTLDPFVPERSFAPELAEVGDLLTYRNFPDVGHDGYYTKREVLDDLAAE